MYNYFRGVIVQANIVQNAQPISPSNIEVASMELPKDDAPTIDELIVQWKEANDSFDPIDELLMDLSNEEIHYANTILDDVDMDMDLFAEVWLTAFFYLVVDKIWITSFTLCIQREIGLKKDYDQNYKQLSDGS